MADRKQFANRPDVMNEIHAYMRGEGELRSPETYFTPQSQQSNFLEMLARLLSEGEYKDLVSGWHGGDASAYGIDPRYEAARQRSMGTPSYIAPQGMAGKSSRY